MKKTRCYLILIALLWSLPHSSTGQDAQSEIAKVQQYYMGLSSYRFDIMTKVFSPDDFTQPIEQQKSVFMKKGDQFVYTAGEITMLVNDQYSLTCNAQSKIIACSKRKSSESLFTAPDILSVLESFDEVEFKGYSEGLKCYFLKRPDAANHLIEFYVDEKKYEMKRLVYHYQEGIGLEVGKVVMDLESSKIDALTDRLFSEKEFVKVKDGLVALQDKYKDYHLIAGEGLESANPQ